jgi:hypothetical protein
MKPPLRWWMDKESRRQKSFACREFFKNPRAKRIRRPENIRGRGGALPCLKNVSSQSERIFREAIGQSGGVKHFKFGA